MKKWLKDARSMAMAPASVIRKVGSQAVEEPFNSLERFTLDRGLLEAQR